MNADLIEAVQNIPLIIRNSDFLGYCLATSEYIFKGKRKAKKEDKIIELMSLSDVLAKIGKYHLIPTVASHCKPILLSEMKKIPYVAVSRVKNESGEIPPEQTTAYYDTYSKLEIYRSTNKTPPQYGEFIFYNAEIDRLITVDQVNPEIVYAAKQTTESELKKDKGVDLVPTKWNPTIHSRFFDEFDINAKMVTRHLNLANAPVWRAVASPDIKPFYGGFMKRLIEHLFVDLEDRAKVLDWIHHALVGRAQTCLVLLGGRGTGKTTFTECLGHCVGIDYYHLIDESSVTGSFNGPQWMARLVAWEEVPLTAKVMTHLKEALNDTVLIHMKGEDQTQAENHASHIMLFNDLRDVEIGQVERRISMPRITSARLEESFAPEEIDWFKKGCKNKSLDVMNEIAQFCLYMYEYEPKTSSLMPIKGEFYFEVTEHAMPIWKKHVCEYVAENGVGGEYISMGEIFTACPIKDKLPFKDAIRDFINSYLFREKFPLGKFTDEPLGYSEKLKERQRSSKEKFQPSKDGPKIDRQYKDRKYGIEVSAKFCEMYKKIKMQKEVEVKNGNESESQDFDLL